MPALRQRWSKLLVLLAFTTTAFLSLAALPRVQVGLDQAVALPRDSYLQAYYSQLLSSLRVGPPLFFVVEDLQLSSDVNKVCSVSGCSPDSMLSQVGGWGTEVAELLLRVYCAQGLTVTGTQPTCVGARLRLLSLDSLLAAVLRRDACLMRLDQRWWCWCACIMSRCAAVSLPQISQAARRPDESFIATGAASWLDDFLSWINPALPKCCR